MVLSLQFYLLVWNTTNTGSGHDVDFSFLVIHLLWDFYHRLPHHKKMLKNRHDFIHEIEKPRSTTFFQRVRSGKRWNSFIDWSIHHKPFLAFSYWLIHSHTRTHFRQSWTRTRCQLKPIRTSLHLWYIQREYNHKPNMNEVKTLRNYHIIPT